MARDESRDIGITEDLEPFSWSLPGPDNGQHYVPHDQLEAAERRIVELEKALTDNTNIGCDALAKCATRIAELEQQLEAFRADAQASAGSAIVELPVGFPPRCRDGCEHWSTNAHSGVGYCSGKNGLFNSNGDGSSWCSNHTKLTNTGE